MSLDDLIKINKQTGRGRGRGGGGGGGKARGGEANGKASGPVRSRGQSRLANRAAPYALSKPVQKAPESAWHHDMFDNQVTTDVVTSNRLLKIETGTKVAVSNLDYGVSNDDIKELFSEVGDLKRMLSIMTGVGGLRVPEKLYLQGGQMLKLLSSGITMCNLMENPLS